jgi:hypothetical protein
MAIEIRMKRCGARSVRLGLARRDEETWATLVQNGFEMYRHVETDAQAQRKRLGRGNLSMTQWLSELERIAGGWGGQPYRGQALNEQAIVRWFWDRGVENDVRAAAGYLAARLLPKAMLVTTMRDRPSPLMICLVFLAAPSSGLVSRAMFEQNVTFLSRSERFSVLAKLG